MLCNLRTGYEIDITSLKGLLKRPKGKVATIEQIKEAPRLGAQRRFKRSAP